MKLRHALAGTVALPLALAVASTASAATIVDNDEHRLNIGGFVAANANWHIADDAGDLDDVNYSGMGLGTSRLNITHTMFTDSGDITIMYENDFGGAAAGDGSPGYRLRHAAIMHDGWVAGHTWSGFANLTGLAETIDAAGTAINSSWANRNAVLGRNIDLGDGMSAGVFVEDGTKWTDREARTAIPDLVANFKGNFGGADVFVAARMLQWDDPSDATDTEMRVDVTAGLNMNLSDTMNLKAAVSNYDGDDTYISVAGQLKLNDQLRTNLVVEQALRDMDDTDYTAIWVNAFYTMPAGWEWGAEVRYVAADDLVADWRDVGGPNLLVNGLGDGDMMVSLQAKYAF